MAERPETPLPVRRELRKEACFGCCRCGFAIVQYHHIVPYSVVPDFRPEDMMALCTRCHDAVRGGALTESEQRRLKADPYNRHHGRAKGTIYLKQDYIPLDVGGGVFLVGDALNIRIDGKSVLRLQRTHIDTLSISTEITNDQGVPLLHIEDNDWFAMDELPWDIEVDWGKILIRQAPRKILLELDATKVPMRLRGAWDWLGRRVNFSDGRAQIGKAEFRNLGLVGFNFELSGDGMKFGPAFGENAWIVSESDPRERLYKSRKLLYDART